MQYGYARSHGVNLLASDFNRPSEQFGGSGIYSHDGKILGNVISYTSKSEMIIADIPKIQKRTPPLTKNPEKIENSTTAKPQLPQNKPESDSFVTGLDDLSKYTFETVKNVKRTQHKLCKDDYCCKFDITKEVIKSPSPVYKYVLAVNQKQKSDNNFSFVSELLPTTGSAIIPRTSPRD